MRRSRLKATGRKAARRLKARRAFREGVLKRAAGRCDRCGVYAGSDLHAHHFRPRSLGGSDDPRLPSALLRLAKHPPSDHGGNGVALCPKCHLDCHMRRGSAAAWIDSHNRSLSLQKGHDDDHDQRLPR